MFPESLRGPGRVPRYESLDVWRGVACLLVIAIHSLAYVREGVEERFHAVFHAVLAVLHRGWLGVPLFFVISGYCITATVEASRARGQSLGVYFYRRFRRIYPPYWVWLLLVATLVWIVDAHVWPGFAEVASVPRPESLNGWQWLGNLTLTETWRFHVGGGPTSFLLSPAWTLCYEEQFYACAGLALLLSTRTSFFKFALAVTLATLAVLGWGWLFTTDARARLQGFFFDGSWLMFAAGILVYYVVARATLAERRWCLATLLVALLVALRDPSVLLGKQDNELTLSCAVAFGFALLLVVLHPYDAALVGVRALQPIKWCGVRCYSLYLVHWPIVRIVSKLLDLAGLRTHAHTVLVTVPLCTAAAILAGGLFHAAVERRFLNAPRP